MRENATILSNVKAFRGNGEGCINSIQFMQKCTEMRENATILLTTKAFQGKARRRCERHAAFYEALKTNPGRQEKNEAR